LLLNLDKGSWDEELCRFFDVPRLLLPEIRPSAAAFGVTAGLDFLPDGIPITGVAGDQQAALFGQGGFRAGDAKCTYGTGAFYLEHTGDVPIRSGHRLLASLAALPTAKLEYVLEGSVFVAGAAVQWLRDGLHFIPTAAEVEDLAARSDPEQPVIFVPGFVGLGAPHWVPEARGVIFGLTRNTTAADLARAALEGVALQVADLIDAAASDTGQHLRDQHLRDQRLRGLRGLRGLRVDGGMARNAWFLQCQADFLGIPVIASPHSEATALGAAFLAGLQAGIWSSLDALATLSQAGTKFEPKLDAAKRNQKRDTWRRAVRAVIAYSTGK
jgi:glycerol kinase